VSLSPVPSQQTEAETCSNCSAPLASDQRYCLACGQPVSPVRLSFLDVLSADAQAQPYAGAAGALPAGALPAVALPAGYAPVIEPSAGSYAWLRRYSGLFGLLSVLLLAIVAGLLVGHWVTQGNAPSRQIVKVEGLGGLAAAAAPATSTGATSGSATTPAAGAASAGSSAATKETAKEAAKTEAHEAQEAKAIEKKPPPKAVKVSSEKLKKLGSTSGQKHEQEINKLGAQPIETGG